MISYEGLTYHPQNNRLLHRIIGIYLCIVRKSILASDPVAFSQYSATITY